MQGNCSPPQTGSHNKGSLAHAHAHIQQPGASKQAAQSCTRVAENADNNHRSALMRAERTHKQCRTATGCQLQLAVCSCGVCTTSGGNLMLEEGDSIRSATASKCTSQLEQERDRWVTKGDRQTAKSAMLCPTAWVVDYVSARLSYRHQLDCKCILQDTQTHILMKP